MSGEWWVLVETSSWVSDEGWMLKRETHVPEGKERAIELAEEQCRTYRPPYFGEADRLGRRVYRASETEWIVRVVESYWNEGSNDAYTREGHFRVTVAELVAVTEVTPARPPEKKGLFGRRKS